MRTAGEVLTTGDKTKVVIFGAIGCTDYCRPVRLPRTALGIQEVADMGPDALELLERETFQQWDRANLVAGRRVIDARRRELAG